MVDSAATTGPVIPVEMWQYSTGMTTEVPALLREIADRLDADESAVFVGMWSTGFGEAWETTLQVVIDREARDAE